jgi:hypothetical protein
VLYLSIIKNKQMKYIKCEMCGYENHEDNFKCEGEDCGIPLDLTITTNSFGLPEITQKKTFEQNLELYKDFI